MLGIREEQRFLPINLEIQQKQLTGQGVKGRITDMATRCDLKQNK